MARMEGSAMQQHIRCLVVTATASGFLAETMYSRNGLDWSTLSTTATDTFPLYIVARVAGRAEYQIRVRYV